MNKMFSKLSGIVTLSLLAILAGVGTYAYYATTKSGVVTANSLSWSFKAGANAGSVSTSNFTITIPDAYPGASGVIPIALSAAGSDVDVDYTIGIAMTSNANGALEFKKENASGAAVTLGPTALSGKLTKGTTGTVNLYWSWPYGAAADNSMAGKTTTFTFTITGKQAQPTE